MSQRRPRRYFAIVCGTLLISHWLLTIDAHAVEDKIELETTIIKGNTELPRVIYLVPWQDISESKSAQQKLKLHSLFGDLFEPMSPQAPDPALERNE